MKKNKINKHQRTNQNKEETMFLKIPKAKRNEQKKRQENLRNKNNRAVEIENKSKALKIN